MRFIKLFVCGLLAASLVSLPLASCSPDSDPDPQEEPRVQEEPEEPQQPAISKTLVAWYSFTGNSRAIANTLLANIKADALEIKPAEDGLDYAADNYALGSSLIDAIRKNPSSPSSYPGIKETDIRLDKYDTVVVVTPLWWSQMAAPMQSFLFSNSDKLAGKTIGLIVTSASSGISGVENDAKRLIPDGRFLPESLWIRSSQLSNVTGLVSEWYNKMTVTQKEGTAMKINISAGGKSFSADIENTETGKAFYAKLPMTLEMSELNGNEKYCYGVNLPSNDTRYDSIASGDLMLYNGNCIVLFYGAAGGYSYTRIGKIADTSGLAEALGKGSVSVKYEKL